MIPNNNMPWSAPTSPNRTCINSSFPSAGSPFGYLQCYDLSDWNTGLGPQPDGTRGIDLFIGDPDMDPNAATAGPSFVTSLMICSRI